MNDQINIAVVDDHHLFRSGIINLVKSLDSRFNIIFEACNGKEFIEKLSFNTLPDIVLLDISMPIMDGFRTAEKLRGRYPEIKVLVLSMNDNEESLIKMLKLGVKGFIGKDIDPNELKKAIISVSDNSYYYTELMTSHLVNSYQNVERNEVKKALTDNELKFLELLCSEDTYAQIADKMCLSPRTIHGYRDSIFSKLDIHSRVGLVIYAIKVKLVVLE